MTTRKVLNDITTGKVLRHGFVDFANEACFDGVNEEVRDSNFRFDPPTEEQDWKWNGTTYEQL